MTEWDGRSVFVSGAAGFLGQHLVVRLLGLGARVVALDLKRPEHCLPALYIALNQNQRLSWIEGSFLDRRNFAESLQECSLFFHMACTLLPADSNDHVQRDIQENLLGSIALFQEFAKSQSLSTLSTDRRRRIIVPSSGGTVYGVPQSIPIAEDHGTNPICSYGAVKLGLEKYLGIFESIHGVSYAALRISNPFGPGQLPKSGHGVIPNFIQAAVHDQPIEIWGDGSIVRDYLYVDDVINALILAAEHPQSFIANIGSGTGLSLNQIYRAIQSALGRPVRVVYKDRRAVDVPANVLDSSKARALLSWRPISSFDSALTKTIDWVRTLDSG